MGQHGYTHGDFGWTELSTTNAAEALEFYSKLLDLEIKGEPMPGYHVVGRGSEMLAGITDLQKGDSTPRWMPYITVDDLDATLAKVDKLNGSVCLAPTALPDDGGRIAIIKDPHGIMTGLAQYSKKS